VQRLLEEMVPELQDFRQRKLFSQVHRVCGEAFVLCVSAVCVICVMCVYVMCGYSCTHRVCVKYRSQHLLTACTCLRAKKVGNYEHCKPSP